MKKFLAGVVVSCIAVSAAAQSYGAAFETAYDYGQGCNTGIPEKQLLCLAFLQGAKRGFAAASVKPSCQMQLVGIPPLSMHSMLLALKEDNTLNITKQLERVFKTAAPECQ